MVTDYERESQSYTVIVARHREPTGRMVSSYCSVVVKKTMCRYRRTPTVLLSGLFMATAAMGQAQHAAAAMEQTEPGVGVAAKLGTPGLGAEVTVPLPHAELNLRAGFYWTDIQYNGVEISDVRYDADVQMLHGLVLLDWHCFDNNFRVSSGLTLNQNDLSLDATPQEPIYIGGVEYPPQVIGTLRSTLDCAPIAPYIGIGYGNGATSVGRWNFSFDVGVVFQDYDVELTASGPAGTYPSFQADLQEEEDEIQDWFDRFSIFPVVTVGIGYRF